MVVSNVCYFHPETWGRSHFDSYFSNGLKPPTSEGFGALGVSGVSRGWKTWWCKKLFSKTDPNCTTDNCEIWFFNSKRSFHEYSRFVFLKPQEVGGFREILGLVYTPEWFFPSAILDTQHVSFWFYLRDRESLPSVSLRFHPQSLIFISIRLCLVVVWGPVVWIPKGSPKRKGIGILGARTPIRIPNHRAPNQQLSWLVNHPPPNVPPPEIRPY